MIDCAVTEGGMKEGRKKKSHAWWEKNFKKHYAEMLPDVVPLLAGQDFSLKSYELRQIPICTSCQNRRSLICEKCKKKNQG